MWRRRQRAEAQTTSTFDLSFYDAWPCQQSVSILIERHYDDNLKLEFDATFPFLKAMWLVVGVSYTATRTTVLIPKKKSTVLLVEHLIYCYINLAGILKVVTEWHKRKIMIKIAIIPIVYYVAESSIPTIAEKLYGIVWLYFN